MADVAPIPPGEEGFIPHLVVKGASDAIEFYKKAFDAEEIMRMPHNDGRLMYAQLRVDGHPLYLTDDFPEMCGGVSRNPKELGNSCVTIHRYVPDADAAIKQAEEAGATVTMPATDTFWGDRFGQVTDPFGHVWSIATHVRDVPPDEMDAARKAMFGG